MGFGFLHTHTTNFKLFKLEIKRHSNSNTKNHSSSSSKSNKSQSIISEGLYQRTHRTPGLRARSMQLASEQSAMDHHNRLPSHSKLRDLNPNRNGNFSDHSDNNMDASEVAAAAAKEEQQNVISMNKVVVYFNKLNYDCKRKFHRILNVCQYICSNGYVVTMVLVFLFVIQMISVYGYLQNDPRKVLQRLVSKDNLGGGIDAVVTLATGNYSAFRLVHGTLIYC